MNLKKNINNTGLKNIRFRSLLLSPDPVLRVNWEAMNSVRLRKGISLRSMHKLLSEDYNIFTSRKYINDFFNFSKTECRAVFFIAVVNLLGVSLEDCIQKCNQTRSGTGILNNQNAKKNSARDQNIDREQNIINKKKECVF